MYKFQRYSYLLTGAFLVVVLISLSFLGLQWQAAYAHEQAVIQKKFTENAINLDAIVKSVVDQLHVLQVNAEENLILLSNNKSPALPLKTFENGGESRYRLPVEDSVAFAAFGNLQGIGNLQNRSDAFSSEVAMTTRLVPSFRSIKENLEEVTWAYYVSAQEFMNLYPYDADVEYQREMTELSFFTQGLPKNNPQRKTSWTEAYVDLAGQGLMVSADAPVYDGDEQFRGIVGLDITLDRLNSVIQNFDYAQGTLLISGANQQLLAYPSLNITDAVQSLESVLPTQLQNYAERILSIPDNQFETIGPFLVIHKAIQNTPWNLIFFVPKSAIYNTVAASGLLASLIPLAGLGVCLLATNRLLNYGFIQPACQLVNHIEQEKKARTTALPENLPKTWIPWFKTVSEAFQENRKLLQTLEVQLNNLQTTQLQLVQSQKMSALGNLVAGVAHEINNPVGFVSGNVTELKLSLKDITDYIQLLEKGLSHPTDEISQARDDLEIEFLLNDLPAMLVSMQSGCDRIRNISKSLRLFARSDDETKFKANIHESIDSSLLILKYRLKATDKRPKIEIICNYSELPDISCFPGQLSQVFMNILANAIDMFDERAGTMPLEKLWSIPQKIIISTQLLPSKAVEICIQDNGTGMPKDVCDRIFDRKFTTKTVGKGTGLGLAISHQVITEKHNGTIDVCSHPNEGTEFLILLPVADDIKQ